MTTILVDEALCTRCGICSAVCPVRIVDPSDENTLPGVTDTKGGMCIRCGHCEVSCPSQALLLNYLPDEKVRVSPGAGTISPIDLGLYIRMRRSVRHYKKDPVAREIIMQLLDIARYAASGGNGQPVQWLVVCEPEEVHRLAGLTVDWMKTLRDSGHPMSGYVPSLIAGWEHGYDPICRGAPHLLIAHIPDDNHSAPIDAIISMTHADIAAPAFGIGTCWAGFLSMAAGAYKPLQDALALPPGRKCAYAMMFGYPQYKTHGIPRRKPLEIMWR